MHWCTPAVMFCEVNLSQKFLHAKKSCIIPASLSWKWGRLNLMISGRWLLTACEDLWIPCNLHFCHGSDVLPLHGVCEHMERTSGVIRILPFHYHEAFNTVQLRKSVYQQSRSYFHQFKVTLTVSRCQLPCLSCMHEAQNTIRNRAICRNPPVSLSVLFSACDERWETKSFSNSVFSWRKLVVNFWADKKENVSHNTYKTRQSGYIYQLCETVCTHYYKSKATLCLPGIQHGGRRSRAGHLIQHLICSARQSVLGQDTTVAWLPSQMHKPVHSYLPVPSQDNCWWLRQESLGFTTPGWVNLPASGMFPAETPEKNREQPKQTEKAGIGYHLRLAS